VNHDQEKASKNTQIETVWSGINCLHYNFIFQ